MIRVQFIGRLKNAIGIFYTINETILTNDDNTDNLRLQLILGNTLSGKAYDHVQGLRIFQKDL